MRFRLLAFLTAFPAIAGAQQVGYTPADSPFRDVDQATRIAGFLGWYRGAPDVAGILPKGGPMVGFRWDVHVGGPADLAVRLSHVSTDRHVIDPTKAPAARIVDTRQVSLGLADVGIVFNLTGNKTWHSLIPLVYGSVGIVTDFAGTDIGGFQHGTTFALGYGLGVRYARPNARLGLRADLGSYMYSMQYPASYYVPGADGTSVLTAATPRAKWRNNYTVSVGVNYTLFK
jgi:hypothetical protein